MSSERPALPVTNGEVLWMRDVLRVGIEKTERPAEDAPLPLLMKYLEARLDTRLPSGRSLQ